MSLVVTENKKKKDPNNRVQDGTYMTRIVQVIDLGEQVHTDWKTGEPVLDERSGEPIYQHKVLITFEFPTERITVDGEDLPRWQSKDYTLSMHEKAALVGLIKSADPTAKLKGYNLTNLIDKPVMATISTTGGGNAKVSGVTGVPKGIPVPPLENDPRTFDMSNPDSEVWDNLPKWQQEKIQSARNYPGSALEDLLENPKNDSRVKTNKPAKAQEDDPVQEQFDDDIPF